MKRRRRVESGGVAVVISCDFANLLVLEFSDTCFKILLVPIFKMKDISLRNSTTKDIMPMARPKTKKYPLNVKEAVGCSMMQ